MCLISKNNVPEVASKSVPVYKVLVRTGSGALLTPYRDMLVPRVPYVMRPDGTQEIVMIVPKNDDYYYEIRGGFIHAYTNRQAAMLEIASWNLPCVVVKGYIPENTVYFADRDNICATEVCLKRVVFEDTMWKNGHCKVEQFPWYYCWSYRGTCGVYFTRLKSMLRQLFCKHK